MKINCWYKNGAGYSIGFDYSPEIVELIKKKIPHTARNWNADKKEWWVNEEYLNELNAIFPGFIETIKSQMVMDLNL
uniref:Uncharacterized protein n=1 Tax=viral metagenome TaxID=1070528 RepID=A0A6M3JIJ5_9ZZZZ